MRAVRRTLLVLVALVVVAIGVVGFNLSRIVKDTVEKEATKSLRLTTTLDRATVNVFSGNLGLHGLAIASPRGFSAPKMLEAGNIAVDVSYAELRKQPIHVTSLTLDAPKLVVEQSGGTLNFRKAMQQLPASDPNKQPMKLVIDRIDVRDAEVVLQPGLPGLQKEYVVKVPQLTMQDVGRGAGAKNGVAIKDVVLQIITALAGKAAQSGGLPIELKGLLHLNVAQVAGALGTDAVKNVAAQALPGGGQMIQDAHDPAGALKSLLPAAKSPAPPKRGR